jgi:hypothetical protein
VWRGPLLFGRRPPPPLPPCLPVRGENVWGVAIGGEYALACQRVEERSHELQA